VRLTFEARRSVCAVLGAASLFFGLESRFEAERDTLTNIVDRQWTRALKTRSGGPSKSLDG
jgi:hypothetical protein